MSRYIPVEEYRDIESEWLINGYDAIVFEQKVDELIAEKSIDIVRCGECAKRMTDDCPMCNECNFGKVPTEDDDFCSYGEREGE